MVLKKGAITEIPARLEFISDNCAGCGLCESVCVKKAINILRAGKSFTAEVTDDCNLCGLCAEFCFYNALGMYLNGSKSSIFGKLYHLDRLSFSSDKCTYCGLCEKACERDAISVKRELNFQRAFEGFIEVSEDICDGCGLCRDICGYSAIEIDRKAKPNEKCLFCGLCADICPHGAIRVTKRKKSDPIVSTGFSFSNYRCSLCGECERVCPTGAIEVLKPLAGFIEYARDRCIEKCTVCMEVCRNRAINIEYRGGKDVIFMEEKCNLCGTCEKFCPEGAIRINRGIAENLELDGLIRTIRNGKKSTGRDIEIMESCSGCGVCVEVCPVSGNSSTVLEVYGGKGEPRLIERCSICGLCMDHCPEDAIQVDEVTE